MAVRISWIHGHRVSTCLDRFYVVVVNWLSAFKKSPVYSIQYFFLSHVWASVKTSRLATVLSGRLDPATVTAEPPPPPDYPEFALNDPYMQTYKAYFSRERWAVSYSAGTERERQVFANVQIESSMLTAWSDLKSFPRVYALQSVYNIELSNPYVYTCGVAAL